MEQHNSYELCYSIFYTILLRNTKEKMSRKFGMAKILDYPIARLLKATVNEVFMYSCIAS